MALQDDATSILIKLGFTQLESDIYTFLLTTGPTTGYGVAKGVGKPVANVYKAVDSLSKKGAIELTSGEKKKCVAIPWKQLIAGQKRQFEKDVEVLEQAFRNLPTPNASEDVFQINNMDQLKDSCVDIINQSQHILVADIEPGLVDFFKGPLTNAAKRGVEVIVKLYHQIEITGVKVILRENGEEVYDKTADRQFSLCADGLETIVAMATADSKNVIQAFKTRSSLMSLTVYSKLVYECVLTQLKQAIPAGDLVGAQAILKQTEHLHPFSAENAIFSNFKKTYASRR